ncbi:MAG: S46 family peptidase [Longimicrobiales bacterium]
MRRKIERYVRVLLLPLAAGCAASSSTATPRPPVAPPATAPSGFSLEPDAAAVRSAENVALTGLEMGTMWTFENPPLEYWRDTYEFSPPSEWLENVRLASLRFGEICSASFVSAGGLAMSNHHCARPCIEANSSPDRDHVERGFLADNRREERVCPDLWLDQLISIEDVSARMTAVVRGSAMTDHNTQSNLLARERAAIRRECERETGSICQVVALHQGVRHMLYRYKRYPVVKLVFAPELQAAFFGGDPDNFTYPRHALDVSFVRAYEADGRTPARTPHHFAWREEGASEGEPVFVTGNPASTSRLITVSQLLYERVYRHPFIIQVYSGERDLLIRLAERDAQAADQTRQGIFEVENGLKAFTGQLAGLRDSLLVATKLRWERELRARIDADADLRWKFGDVWDRIEQLQWTKLETGPRLNIANLELVGSPHLAWAGELVEYIEQIALPEAQRTPEFRREQARLETVLSAQAPIDESFSLEALALHIDLAKTWLRPEDPLRSALIEPGETPIDAARRLAYASGVLDANVRVRFIKEGRDALVVSQDPLVRFALLARKEYSVLRQRWNETAAAEAIEKRRLAEALFAVQGDAFPPDATFTLRISDGIVKRYPANGTVQAPVTTLYGLYARAAAFSNAMPWTLPESFDEARLRVRLSTPLNLVATTDITGGNSGSPMIDRDGRIVGLVFDSNLEQLPNEFLFRPGAGRTIAVHAAAIIEALRSVYGASALLTEILTGEATPTGARDESLEHPLSRQPEQ